MKHLLSIEYIGYSYDQEYWGYWRLAERPLGIKPNPPYAPSVCKLGINENERITREYLRGEVDFSQANSAGSRGVRKLFHLNENRLYRIEFKPSWASRDVYWTVWEDGVNLNYHTEEEAVKWLRKYYSDAAY